MTHASNGEDRPSGERFEPARMHGQVIEAEHLVRYAWAAQFAAGRRVLDAACGTAYGTAILAAAGAEEVVGVDVDEDTIAAVREEAPVGVRFDRADLEQLPYPDGRFDLVVSFETIEHVQNPGAAFDELRRVLRPGGTLAISTPNRDVYNPGNPFHVREFSPEEFEAELRRRFEHVRLRRQQTWVSSAIFDDECFRRGGHERIEDVEVRKAAGNEPGRETYTLALASDEEPQADRALLTLTADIEFREWNRYLESADSRAEELRSELATTQAMLGEAQAVTAAYEEMRSSTSWRLTRPLRALGRRLRRARRRA